MGLASKLSITVAYCLHGGGSMQEEEHQHEDEAVFCPKTVKDSFFLLTLDFGLDSLQGEHCAHQLPCNQELL